MKKDNVIFFSINNSYSFALATLLFSLKDTSKRLINTSDIIIYHDGISIENQNKLKLIIENIHFEQIILPNKWKEMANDKVVLKWGLFVLVKLFAFKLISSYKKAIFLDADMLALKDLSDLLDIEEDIAWRQVLAWNPKENYEVVLENKDDYISAPNGGLIILNQSIKKYNITDDKICEYYYRIKDLKRGGIDERLFSYISYKNGMKLKELKVSYNTPAGDFIKGKHSDAKMIHFIGAPLETKPWKSPAVYDFFPEWAKYYNKWLEIGGTGPIDITKKDLYNPIYKLNYLRFLPIFSEIIKNSRICKDIRVTWNIDVMDGSITFKINDLGDYLRYKIKIISDKEYEIITQSRNDYGLFNEFYVGTIKKLGNKNIKLDNSYMDKKLVIRVSDKLVIHYINDLYEATFNLIYDKSTNLNNQKSLKPIISKKLFDIFGL